MVQNKKKIVSSTGSAGRMCFDTREGALRTAGLVRLPDWSSSFILSSLGQLRYSFGAREKVITGYVHRLQTLGALSL